MPIAENNPDVMSEIATPTFSGSPPASPVTLITPPIACATKSYPGVAFPRPLDLDHVGAQVPQHHRGERAREDAREIGDPDTLQRERHGRASGLPFRGQRGLVVSGGAHDAITSISVGPRRRNDHSTA